MSFLLVGNYGVGNLGDELLRDYFLQAYPEVEWTVIKANSELPRLPFGIRSLIMTPWWKTLSALRKSDGMVFGGGTLFTDIESVKAPLLWWWHAVWARIFRKKIILAFQGIGPFHSRIGEWCARWVVARAECTIVRDAKSLKRISSWKNKKIVQSFDPVFSLFQSEKNHDRSQKLFIIIPRANTGVSFTESVQDLRKKMQAEAHAVRVVSLEPGHPGEKEICAALAETFQGEVVAAHSLDTLVQALEGASLVITQRYHGAIAALGMDVPFIAVPQKEGDKLAAVAHIHRSDAIRWLKEGESVLRNTLKPSTYQL